MSKELKPCPFCGETRLTIEDNQKVRDVHVLCKDCGAKTSFDGIRYDVAGRWNTRPLKHALQKRLEELEAENSYLREMLNKIRVKASLHAEACECGPDAARLRLIEKESEKVLKRVGYVRSKFD